MSANFAGAPTAGHGTMSGFDHGDTGPRIRWDGRDCVVTLPMAGGGSLTAKWEPKMTYVVRIREVGKRDWSFGFETPVAGGAFRGLRPDTEYEVEFLVRGPSGESGPVPVRFRTDPAGESGKVIPFPKR